MGGAPARPRRSRNSDPPPEEPTPRRRLRVRSEATPNDGKPRRPQGEPSPSKEWNNSDALASARPDSRGIRDQNGGAFGLVRVRSRVLTHDVIAWLALAAFTAGLVDAIAGGGGLLTVPALLAAGLPPQAALATNKGQAAFGAISSFVSFWMRGGIDRKRFPVAFACGFAGSLAGAWVLLRVDPAPLKPVVLGLLLAAAVFVAWPRKPSRGRAHSWAMKALVPVAFALGFYDGFFGPGVGSMLIIAFVLLFGDTLTRASGNAKVVNLASNLAALALFATRGVVLWKIALPMAVANAAGAFVGARLAVKKGDGFVRGVVLVVVVALVLKVARDLVRG